MARLHLTTKQTFPAERPTICLVVNTTAASKETNAQPAETLFHYASPFLIATPLAQHAPQLKLRFDALSALTATENLIFACTDHIHVLSTSAPFPLLNTIKPYKKGEPRSHSPIRICKALHLKGFEGPCEAAPSLERPLSRAGSGGSSANQDRPAPHSLLENENLPAPSFSDIALGLARADGSLYFAMPPLPPLTFRSEGPCSALAIAAGFFAFADAEKFTVLNWSGSELYRMTLENAAVVEIFTDTAEHSDVKGSSHLPNVISAVFLDGSLIEVTLPDSLSEEDNSVPDEHASVKIYSVLPTEEITQVTQAFKTSNNLILSNSAQIWTANLHNIRNGEELSEIQEINGILEKFSGGVAQHEDILNSEETEDSPSETLTEDHTVENTTDESTEESASDNEDLISTSEETQSVHSENEDSHNTQHQRTASESQEHNASSAESETPALPPLSILAETVFLYGSLLVVHRAFTAQRILLFAGDTAVAAGISESHSACTEEPAESTDNRLERTTQRRTTLAGHVLLGGADGDLRWVAESGRGSLEVAGAFMAHSDGITALERHSLSHPHAPTAPTNTSSSPVSEPCELVLTASRDGTVKVWKAGREHRNCTPRSDNEENEKQELSNPLFTLVRTFRFSSAVTAAAIGLTADNTLALVVATHDFSLHIFNSKPVKHRTAENIFSLVRSMEETASQRLHAKEITAVGVTPQFLISVSMDKTALLMSSRGAVQRKIEGDRFLGLSMRSGLFWSGGAVSAGSWRSESGEDESVEGRSFGNDSDEKSGSFIALHGQKGITVLSASTGERVAVFQTRKPVLSCLFYKDFLLSFSDIFRAYSLAKKKCVFTKDYELQGCWAMAVLTRRRVRPSLEAVKVDGILENSESVRSQNKNGEVEETLLLIGETKAVLLEDASRRVNEREVEEQRRAREDGILVDRYRREGRTEEVVKILMRKGEDGAAFKALSEHYAREGAVPSVTADGRRLTALLEAGAGLKQAEAFEAVIESQLTKSAGAHDDAGHGNRESVASKQPKISLNGLNATVLQPICERHLRAVERMCEAVAGQKVTTD